METAVLAPQHANPIQAAGTRSLAGTQARNAAAMAAARKFPAARRKTLCDITNLRQPLAAAPAAEEGPRCADGAEAVARLVRENLDLLRLLEQRDKFIEASGAEMQNLRLANWQLAQANSQMLAELNLGKNRLKSLQHELTCSRAALKVKSSELEEAKKVIRSSKQQQQKSANEMARQLAADRAAAAQLKDGDAESASDALRAASASKPACNPSRKRLMRSRSLGPTVAPTKPVAASKERESAQRRKSMRTPQPSGRREDLFEIEDVQLAVSSGNDRKETAWGQESSTQFPRRSSLGRPLRRATEQVTSYKEMPVNIKLRRS